jgi:hypothetical protein
LTEQVHNKIWERQGISTKEKVSICWDGNLEDDAEEHSWQARLKGLRIKYEIRVRVVCRKKVNMSRTNPMRLVQLNRSKNIEPVNLRCRQKGKDGSSIQMV